MAVYATTPSAARDWLLAVSREGWNRSKSNALSRDALRTVLSAGSIAHADVGAWLSGTSFGVSGCRLELSALTRRSPSLGSIDAGSDCPMTRLGARQSPSPRPIPPSNIARRPTPDRSLLPSRPSRMAPAPAQRHSYLTANTQIAPPSGTSG